MRYPENILSILNIWCPITFRPINSIIKDYIASLPKYAMEVWRNVTSSAEAGKKRRISWAVSAVLFALRSSYRLY